MKSFAVILSTFFLALNLIPCADEDHSADTSGLEDVCSDHEEEGKTPGDLCSPFCQQCHCCGINIADLLSAEFVYNPEISTAIFLHFENSGEEIQFSRFQPPRV